MVIAVLMTVAYVLIPRDEVTIRQTLLALMTLLALFLGWHWWRRSAAVTCPSWCRCSTAIRVGRRLPRASC